MKARFEFPIVTDTQPLAEDPFFDWLNQNVKRSEPGSSLKMAIKYLYSLGFDKEIHVVNERDLKTLEYVHEVWCRVTPFPPIQFSDHFTPVKEGGFHVKTPAGYKQRYSVSRELKDMLDKSGWVYQVEPDSTYFELESDGRLFAKYQQILGSRFICRVEGFH